MIGFEQRAWLAPLKILPSPTVTVMFQLADQFPGTPRVFVVGPRTSAATIFPIGATACVDVKLTPVGAARLFGPVLGDMIDQQVDLDVLLRGRRADLLIDQLLEGTWPQRLITVERFLMDRLGMAAFVPPEVDWAWQAIRRTCGEVRVGRLVAETGWSHRHFVRQFRRHTGLAPKAAGRLIRLSAVLQALQHEEPISLAELAVRSGHYDQAHMSREVRRGVGATPGQLMTARDLVPPASVAESPSRPPLR